MSVTTSETVLIEHGSACLRAPRLGFFPGYRSISDLDLAFDCAARGQRSIRPLAKRRLREMAHTSNPSRAS